MFESFYGLSRTPFARDIPTDQLYQSVMLEETLGRLQYAAKRQLFAVVTGDCGTGKTTTVRLFKGYFGPGPVHGHVPGGLQAHTPAFLQGAVGTAGL